ncbi:unnamed protein product [Caenorhabditis sp. 36 PRJEB53466]|nr:unnamed protein product [Caenorhabditis sp. 36 PRJEB53466]
MPKGDLFSNCSNHYPIEQYFLNCTNTTRPCELISDLAIVAELLVIFDYYLSTVLFSLAGIFNAYNLSISLPLFLRMDEEHQKRYVFVLSRCISSISAAATLLVLRCVLYVYFPPGTSSYYLYVLVVIADDISFYSLQGAYIEMALLVYVAVIHPMYFSARLTLRKIYLLAIANWVLATVISVPTGLFQTATYVSGPIKCDSQVCGPLVGLINYIIVSIAFFTTILILSFVLIALSCHIHRAKRVDSYTSSQTLHNARSRLAWTLFAITFISLAEGIPSSFLLGLKADNVLSTCTNFYQADKLINVTIFTSLDSIVWAIVLLIDPVANIILDKEVSSEFVKQVNQAKVYFAKFLEFLVSDRKK